MSAFIAEVLRAVMANEEEVTVGGETIKTARFVAVNRVNDLTLIEAFGAVSKWPQFSSAHEGFAVLQEEVDELWEHVKTKQKDRDLGAMQREAVQVAAMALRFAAECCVESVGRR